VRGKPTLCLDFDGVIHSYHTPWENKWTIPDPPVVGAMASIIYYLDEGFDVAIFSSRSSDLRGRAAMKEWLKNAMYVHISTRPIFAGNEPYDANKILRKIKWPWFKPSAFVTIDDRAICFDGTWPTGPQIRSFKPWNKK
jgi:hypothetical protein